VADEGLVHTDPVHDLVGGVCKMEFYIINRMVLISVDLTYELS
jgi:hypothetical protein